jgi:hypothetical protein
MDAFAAELEACLAELDHGADGDATMVLPSRRRAPRRRKQVSRWPIGIGLLALLAVAAIVIGLLAFGRSNNDNAPVASKRVEVTGLTSYDPFGDNKEENSAAAINTTDRNRATYWSTERYNDAPSLNKPGVGLVLDAGTLIELRQLVVVTDTPGFTAQIGATNTQGGAPAKISDSKKVGGTTTFQLDPNGPKRYYVIWITRLPSDSHVAHVNEVRAYKG